MDWSIYTLMATLTVVAATWLGITLAVRFGKIHLTNIRLLSPEDDVIKVLVPILTFVVSVFAYGQSGATATSQNELALAQMKMQTQMAEFRGEMRFRATYDDEWTLKIQRLDSEPFSISKLTLTPSYQRSSAIGPELGKSVHFDPLTKYEDGGRTIVIKNAHVRACSNEESDMCQRTLELLLIDFDFGGRLHRVIAYYKND